LRREKDSPPKLMKRVVVPGLAFGMYFDNIFDIRIREDNQGMKDD